MKAGKAAADDVALKAGRIGSFEVSVDGRIVFSKLERGRFPSDSEIDALA